jgi:hypothetical protein
MALLLGHLNFKSIQMLLRSGVLGRSPVTQLASRCEHPKCASCQYGKARCQMLPSTVQKTVVSHEGAIKADDLVQGQCVSVDHFECTAKGRLYESRGKTTKDSMYQGGCLFIDHASGYVHVEHQVSFSTTDTLRSKHLFERSCLDMGVVVQAYQSDNGVFSSKDFTSEIEKYTQNIQFSGVGAHHQNGVAERGIGTIMSMA